MHSAAAVHSGSQHRGNKAPDREEVKQQTTQLQEAEAAEDRVVVVRQQVYAAWNSGQALRVMFMSMHDHDQQGLRRTLLRTIDSASRPSTADFARCMVKSDLFGQIKNCRKKQDRRVHVILT